MKKILFSLTLIVLMLQSFSQDTTKRVFTKDDYLHKSRSQKTVGRILLGSGVGMMVAGAATYKVDLFENDATHVNNTGSYLLFLGGVGTIIGGAITIGASHRNKQHAVALSISNQHIPLLQQNGLVSKMQPTIRLRIPL